MISILGIFL